MRFACSVITGIFLTSCAYRGNSAEPNVEKPDALVSVPDAQVSTPDADPCSGACTTDQSCIAGACCVSDQVCGTACCGAGDICSFGSCQTPGAVCQESADCAGTEYCELALGELPSPPPPNCVGGAPVPNGRCVIRPPVCPNGQPPGDPPTCLQACEYRPPAAPFAPELKYSWGNINAPNTQDSVMMAPVVIQLDDDSCDGVINERDIPDIVFLTFASGQYNDNGTLHVISIINGTVVEKWTKNAGAISPNHPGRSIAAGNFDGKPGNEIAVCTTDGRVRAYSATGEQLWLSLPGACAYPAIADLNSDGKVEVIADSQILDGATGARVAAFTTMVGYGVYDIDGNGKLDIVGGGRALGPDGRSVLALAPAGFIGSSVAIGDLDRDGKPEVAVATPSTHTLSIWHYDTTAPNNFGVIRQNIDINGVLSPLLCPFDTAGRTSGGGPPTIADFNGDGFPDVALAGGVGYAVFDGVKLMNPSVWNPNTLLWSKQTQDCSSAQTGSSVFDFNGDGKAEVVYGDETNLRIYNGIDGDLLYNTCNTNGTLFEYPLVADVDNDGQADIIVVSNNYSGYECNGTKTTGVRIFGDSNGGWVRTRRVWNQHSYHVTNVSESGEIPTVEVANASVPRLNNYRQNVQPSGEFSAPDLVPTLDVVCSGGNRLVATVRNLGSAAVAKDIPVAFYLGDPSSGGVELPGSPVRTKYALFSTEAEQVVLPLAQPLADNQTVYVVVDPGAAHSWQECRLGNNKASASTTCGVE
jgi:hypothetical protein